MDDWAFAKQHPALLKCHLRYVSEIHSAHRDVMAGAAAVPSWEMAIVHIHALGTNSSLNRRFSTAHLALIINHVEAIKQLLRTTQDTVLAKQCTEQGMTLLHAALLGNVHETVIDKLVRCGCSATARTQWGHTCAMFAALGGNVSFVKRFYSLEHTYEGTTLLTYAAAGGSLDAVKYVCAHRSDVHETDDQSYLQCVMEDVAKFPTLVEPRDK